jgi:hypothetical protein
MIPVFKRAKTVHASDLAATVIGCVNTELDNSPQRKIVENRVLRRIFVNYKGEMTVFINYSFRPILFG